MIKKTFKLFDNGNETSKTVREKVRQLLLSTRKFAENKNAEFNVAIGGDGCFLHMVRACKFNPDYKFVGIHTGTLGFLQEVGSTDEALEQFVTDLAKENFRESHASYITSKIARTARGRHKSVNFLNEIIVEDINHKTAFLNIEVDGTHLQHFAGRGMLICSAIGSTAQNVNERGAVIPARYHALQMTPLTPLTAHANFVAPLIIPDTEANIVITPEHRTTDLLITGDGVEHRAPSASKVLVTLAPKKISRLKMPNSPNAYEKINDKFLSNKRCK